jgi:apolipoprotein N-acyltransferase
MIGATTITGKVALTWKQALALVALAVASFHVAYGFSKCSFLIAVFLYCLCALTRLATDRRAFYFGLTIGILVYAPQLYFFYLIFGFAAIALWSVLAFWLGLFLLLARQCRQRFPMTVTALLIPFLWAGLEYFRSELYYFRFSWLNVGYVFSENPGLPFMKYLGVYGAGFVLMAIMAWVALVRKRLLAVYAVCISLLAASLLLKNRSVSNEPGRNRIAVAGVQMEFPAQLEVPLMLDKLLQQNPDAQLLVLSEYTFDGPVPDRVKDWCRKNHRYLIVGGKSPATEPQYYNTAFVIDPNGEIVFQQVKSVPIQFFKDGLPAKEQKVWDSPWGRIGICVCYDLSYARVTDELIRQGAQALIVPTMDVAEWGGHQHRLHARVAPVRAAEYGVPIFRVCSSGISQLIGRSGHVIATAPFPGDQAMIAGQLRLNEPGTRPFDRWLAPLAVFITVTAILWLGISSRHRHLLIPNHKS